MQNVDGPSDINVHEESAVDLPRSQSMATTSIHNRDQELWSVTNNLIETPPSASLASVISSTHLHVPNIAGDLDSLKGLSGTPRSLRDADDEEYDPILKATDKSAQRSRMHTTSLRLLVEDRAWLIVLLTIYMLLSLSE